MKTLFNFSFVIVFILATFVSFGHDYIKSKKADTPDEKAKQISMEDFPTDMGINHINDWGGMTHIQLIETNATQENPFRKFVGIWGMKEGIWESSFGGKYSKTIDTSFVFIAKSPTNQSLLWNYNLFPAKGVILWTFSNTKKEVYHLSANSHGPMAQGTGTINANGDANLKLYFDEDCATCYRMYRYKFISDDEVYFRASYYKDDKETGDFYGGTFVRRSR